MTKPTHHPTATGASAIRRRRAWLGLTLGALVVVQAGCLSSHRLEQVPLVVAPPALWTQEAGSAQRIDRWWTSFGSEELDQLVDAAMEGNLQLRAAWARLRQAEALVKQSEAGYWPGVDAQLSAGRSRSPAPAPLGAVEGNQFQVSAAAAYEVDIWGKTAAAVSAAEADAIASRDAAESIAVTLAAQIVETWFDLAYQRERRDLVRAQLDTAQTFLELTLLRLNMGQATALDVLQQQQQLDGLSARFALIDAAESTAQQRLAVLLGRAPGTTVAQGTDTLPRAPEMTDAGVPADLLENRPDVRSARRAAEAADARVTVAIANRLPTLRLSASAFLSASSPVDLFDDIFWSVAAAVAGPVFDGGRRSAEVERANAVLDERILSYGQSVLTALQEVESAMVLERQQALYLESLEAQRRTAEAALQTSREQFLRGASDYSRVLTALSAVQQLEVTMLDARRQLLSYRIQLHRALGGHWTRELAAPRSGDTDDAS